MACAIGLYEAVEHWCADDDFVASRELTSVLHAAAPGGKSPFGEACTAVSGGMTQEQRDAGRRCALAVGGHPAFSPSHVSADGMSELAWACIAGLDGLVRDWLARGRLAEGTVQYRDRNDLTAFAYACKLHYDHSKPGGDPFVAVGTRACAVALARSRWVVPNYFAGQLKWSNVYYACVTGIPEVVEYWCQAMPEAVARCIHTPTHEDRTPFPDVCEVLRFTKWPERREAYRRCALALGGHPALDPNHVSPRGDCMFTWACRAGLATLVQGRLASGRVGKDTVLHKDRHGYTAFYYCCAAYNMFSKPNHDPVAVAGARACAWVVAKTGWVPPTGQFDANTGATYLGLACTSGLPEVVEHWMDTCPEAVAACINVCADGGNTAYGSACECAANIKRPPQLRAGCRACALALAEHPAFDPAAPAKNGEPQGKLEARLLAQ